MSADRLEEIKARADAATPGPWEQGRDSGAPWNDIVVGPHPSGNESWCETVADCDTSEENAAFIAAARDDVPWLVSEVARLTAERDALAAQVARVEALAEWFDSVQAEHLSQDDCQCEMKDCYECGPWHACTHNGPPAHAGQLRAALAGSTAQEATTDAGHKCEPYYSRAECGQCGWQEQWCVTCSRQMCGCATDAMGADQ